MNESPKHKIYIGMGGWHLPPFDKFFYPLERTKEFRKLKYYSQFFDLVEVNATFYTTGLTSKTTQQWIKDVSDNKEFVFTMKLHHGFTHSMEASKVDILNIHQAIAPLAQEGKLGGLVLQFPASFYYTVGRRDYIGRLAEFLRPHKLFVEFRHRSWNTPSNFEFLTRNGLNNINVDIPQIRNHIQFTNTNSGEFAYYRMMGRNKKTWSDPNEGERYDYRYKEEELDDLVKRIGSDDGKDLSTFVVFHNDPSGMSLLNGFQLRHLLHQLPPKRTPERLIYAYPELKKFVSSAELELPLFPQEDDPKA